MILAADRNWGIGNKGQLLCHLSGDLKYFKQTTLGHTVIMGRATLESLPGKRGLPGRRNIVLTSQPDFEAERVDAVCHNLEELRAATKDVCHRRCGGLRTASALVRYGLYHKDRRGIPGGPPVPESGHGSRVSDHPAERGNGGKRDPVPFREI